MKMNKALLVLGILWSLPITLICFLFYVMPCWIARWYSFDSWRDCCLVWVLNKNAPEWLVNRWAGWGGHALGNIVVMSLPPDTNSTFKKILRHEQEHVFQCMTLGVFQPLLYLVLLFVGLVTRNTDAYKDNLFEISARRVAGQEQLPNYLK